MNRGIVRMYRMLLAGDPRAEVIFNQALVTLLVFAAVIGIAVFIGIRRRRDSRKLAEEIMEECGVDRDRPDD